MKLNNSFSLDKNGNEFTITNNLSGTQYQIDDIDTMEFYNKLKFKPEKERISVIKEIISNNEIKEEIREFFKPVIETEDIDDNKKADILNSLEKIIDFFNEFEFEPNLRFINTMANEIISSGPKKAKEYIQNYFEITDSPFLREIREKIKSPEFDNIINSIAYSKPKNIINKRFKILYGSQGTGKTTKAIKETKGRCIICNNSMLPSDLMEDFSFEEGKPGFNHSSLWDCMEKGLPITFDEINLLPFDSLRFLQGILDSKKNFEYKGETVNIRDGFYIIGTMNLSVNGMVYGLPEPLVDRCFDIVKFKLTNKDLFEALV